MQRTIPIEHITLEKNVDVDKLIESCTRKLTEDPENTKALLIRASSYVKKQQYQLSIGDYTRAVAMNPNDESIFYNRGTAYEKLGALDEAINDFTMVLNIDPNHVNAAYARAACHNRKGLFSEAIDDYNFALMKDEEARLNAAVEAQKDFSNNGSGNITSIPHSPSRKRTGSFAIGVDKYTKIREQELREQITGNTPPQSPSRKINNYSNRKSINLSIYNPSSLNNNNRNVTNLNNRINGTLHSPPRSPAILNNRNINSNYMNDNHMNKSSVFQRNRYLNTNISGRSTPADVIPAPSSPSIIKSPPNMNQNQQQSQQYGHDQTVNVDNIPVVTRIKSGSIVQETSPNSLNYNYKNQRQQQQHSI